MEKPLHQRAGPGSLVRGHDSDFREQVELGDLGLRDAGLEEGIQD